MNISLFSGMVFSLNLIGKVQFFYINILRIGLNYTNSMTQVDKMRDKEILRTILLVSETSTGF